MKRSGVVPCYYDDGKVYMMYMIPSLEEYGGIYPQLAKGHQEPNLSVRDNAFKEALEELGLVMSNVAWDEYLGLFGNIEVYVCQVYSKKNFAQYGYETGKVGWLSEDEIFMFKESQREIFRQASIKYKQKMGLI